MKKIFVLASVLLPALSFAQLYNVLLIPDSLRTNANVVARDIEYNLEIKSPSHAILREKHVYTILNEAGAKYAGYTEFYDKLKSLNYADGTLYDAMGKEIKHIKKKDMQDLSGSDDESLMDDTRYKRFDFYCRTYPYTVAYEDEQEFEGLLYFPGWMPLSAVNMSVVYSKYSVTAPKDYGVRYRAINYSAKPSIAEEGTRKTYNWEIKNLPAISWERSAPELQELVPNVSVAPSEFEIEGFKGTMNSWSEFGKFLFELYKGRDVLPDDLKAKVHALTDQLHTDREKVFALYDFLQKNTRYISVQLGIGGWQPFDAKYVATKKYGDCKALSNYMVALCKEAGIKANPVVIRAGSDASPLLDDFPSLQGNHVISCVPMKGDTLWLECTSQTVSPGFMGSFTGDRKAILIDADGGHIVNTPRYSSRDNAQVRSVTAAIDAEGNLDATLITHLSGIQQETAHELIHYANKEERDRYLNASLNLPTYQVDKSDYKEEKGIIPKIDEQLHVTSPGYASVTGRRLFIAPNLFNKSTLRYSPDSVRKFDIITRAAFRDVDSVSIQVPAGYVPEAVPQPVKITSKFGTYASSARVDGDRIFYTREYEKAPGRFPAVEYGDMIKFQDQVYRADHSRIVLVKKDQ